MSTALESLLCQHCGAPLQIGPGAEYVTCTHCGTPLRVRRTDSAAWTEIAEDADPDRSDRRFPIGGPAESLEARVDRLDRRAEAAALDRQWDRTRESFMVWGRHGVKYEPTKLRAAGVGGFGVFGGIVSAVMLSATGAPGAVAVGFPLLFAGVGLFGAFRTFQYAERLRQQERRYRRRRRELLVGDEREPMPWEEP